MRRKCWEGTRKEKKLTRLVLGALMLGAGTLWAPTAEAVNIPVTGAPTAAPSTIHTDTVYLRAYPQNNDNTWTLNYTSSDNAWSSYTAYGAFNGTGGGDSRFKMVEF